MCAQGHDALGRREGAARKLALLRQVPEFPLLLLLEEPPFGEVILSAQGQSPQRNLQVMRARGAWSPWLLAVFISARKEIWDEHAIPMHITR